MVAKMVVVCCPSFASPIPSTGFPARSSVHDVIASGNISTLSDFATSRCGLDYPGWTSDDRFATWT